MKLNISSKQALDMELKLNTSPYSRMWIDFGDILYAWRLDPRKYTLDCDTTYTITHFQYKWVQQNILDYSTNDEDNQFTLLIKDEFVTTNA